MAYSLPGGSGSSPSAFVKFFAYASLPTTNDFSGNEGILKVCYRKVRVLGLDSFGMRGGELIRADEDRGDSTHYLFRPPLKHTKLFFSTITIDGTVVNRYKLITSFRNAPEMGRRDSVMHNVIDRYSRRNRTLEQTLTYEYLVYTI